MAKCHLRSRLGSLVIRLIGSPMGPTSSGYRASTSVGSCWQHSLPKIEKIDNHRASEPRIRYRRAADVADLSIMAYLAYPSKKPNSAKLMRHSQQMRVSAGTKMLTLSSRTRILCHGPPQVQP